MSKAFEDARLGVQAVVVATIGFATTTAPSGCAIGPTYTRPTIALDDHWTATRAKASDEETRVDATQAAPDKWWESFDDATLNRLIDIAVKQNLPLQVAGLRVMQARAQLAAAGSQQFPHVALYGDALGIGLSKNLPYVENLPNGRRQFLDFQAGFDASWEADLWGKYRRGVESEQSSLAASQADYDAAIVSLTAEVARTYAVVRTDEVLIAQAKENEKLEEEGLKLAESRSQNGATSELDVAQASALLASTRASVPRLEASLKSARDALATLLGLPTSGVEGLLIVSGTPTIPRAPKSVPVGVPADMLRRRPDVRSAEHRAAAQAARIGVAAADLYPTLTLAGTIGLETTTVGNFDVNPGDALTYRAGPELTWQIFDFGRAENAVRVADAQYQQLLVDYQDAALRAAQEVEDAMATFENAEHAAAFEETAVAAARRAVDIALVQYREGATDYQRVLDSQQRLLDEENALAQTRSDAATGVIALYKALGGGFESFTAAPVSAHTTNEMQNRTNWGDLLKQPSTPNASSAPNATTTTTPASDANKAGQP